MVGAKPGDVPEDYHYLVSNLVNHLSGESIRTRGGDWNSKRVAYDLLRVAHDLLVSEGYRGVVLLIDEAESIFTKLKYITSRKGAYRVLSEFCESPELDFCRTVIAITPDILRWMKEEISTDLVRTYEFTHVAALRTWAEAVLGGSVEAVRCPRLTVENRRDLLERILAVYRMTYPDRVPQRELEKRWDLHLGQVLKRDVSVRILIRSTLDLLDSLSYGL